MGHPARYPDLEDRRCVALIELAEYATIGERQDVRRDAVNLVMRRQASIIARALVDDARVSFGARVCRQVTAHLIAEFGDGEA